MQNPVPLIVLVAIFCAAIWLWSRAGNHPRRW
jgi:hypothetical protein